jgi:hypothetical protein
MILFIPACGDRLTLTEDWTFPAWCERRNMKFLTTQGHVDEEHKDAYALYEGQPYRSPIRKVRVTVPKGSVIECDRVYIRSYNKGRIKDGDDYDSITWKLVDPKKGKAVRHGRFWTKLTDCNGLSFEMALDGLYQNRVKAVKDVMES